MNNEDNMLELKYNSGDMEVNQELEINKKNRLRMLITNEHCIAFNKKQDIPIWNYMLSEDKTKIFVFDENDETIYDGLVIEAPNSIYDYGEIFDKVSFKGFNLEENIVSRENFYLFENQFFG